MDETRYGLRVDLQIPYDVAIERATAALRTWVLPRLGSLRERFRRRAGRRRKKARLTKEPGSNETEARRMESIERSNTPSAEVDSHEERAAPRSPWSELTFRVLFSIIFILAGLGHLVRPAVFVERMLNAPVGQFVASLAPANLLVVGTGVVLLGGGAGLLLGHRTRVAALALIAVLVPITVSTHLGVAGDPGPLLKNIALLGGLIHFAAVGGAEYSVDQWRRGRRTPHPSTS